MTGDEARAWRVIAEHKIHTILPHFLMSAKRVPRAPLPLLPLLLFFFPLSTCHHPLLECAPALSRLRAHAALA